MKNIIKMLGIIALVAVIGFLMAACDDNSDTGGNTPEDLTVTIGQASNGTITASPMKGPSGTEINVWVNPDPGHKYVPGSLKYNTTSITDSGNQPYTFTLTGNVTLTAEFEALPADQYSVTVASTPNGKITANPAYGPEGTLITLTVTPDNSYVLKEGSLTYTPSDGSAVAITGYTFNLPANHVTVNAEFEKGNLDSLINAGISAMEAGNYDAAISSFDSAYALDNNNQAAILYSTLGRLAAIAVNDNVKALMTNRLGITNYPGTISKLISPDWLETYTDEWLEYNYYNGNDWAYWSDEDDSRFFDYYELTPEAGYYKYIQNTWRMILGETTKRLGNQSEELDWYQDETSYYWYWYDQDPSSSNYTYIGFTTQGYYRTVPVYELISTTPQYETDTSSLPGLNVPSWFSDTNLYKESFTSANLKSTTTFSMLLFTNLIDKNSDGLNNLLDDLLSAVFGTAFESAYNRAATLNSNVTLNASTLEAFGLSDIFEGGNVEIGKAELNILFAAMRIVKASLEWVAAYDWNTDLNFLKNGPLWDDWTKLNAYTPANLPLRNNFLKARSNSMMAQSKADFIKAIDDSIAAYNMWIGADSNLPAGYIDTLNEYLWIKDGFTQLKNAIDSGGSFYVKDASGSTTYSNTQQDALFGINMGKFFTPGQLAINMLIENTTISGKGAAPKFYGYQNDNWVEITERTQISSCEVIGFQLNMQPVREIIILGFEEMPDNVELPILPPDYAEHIWDWYN